MPGNISQFLSDIKKYGISKTSHFDVEFNRPTALLGGSIRKGEDQDVFLSLVSGGVENLLRLRCESAELPGRQIATTDNKIYGPIYKTPYQTMYAEMTMTFVDSADMSIRKYFERWMNLIYDAEFNKMGYLDDFMTDFKVRQYDTDGNVVLIFNLLNIFPTNINQLSTSWADDAAHKLSVTFFYERYNFENIPTKNQVTLDLLQNSGVGAGPNQEGLGRIIVNDTQIGAERQKANTIAAGLYQEEMGRQIVANTQVQLALQRAQSEANKSSRTDLGLFGNVIKDIANKVKGL